MPTTVSPDSVTLYYDAMAASPPEIATEVLGAIIGNMPNLREGLLALDIPKHTINSDRSETDPGAAAAHELKVRVMSHVGHFCMLDDPATFNTVLREILKDMIYNDYLQNKSRP